ncbi:hypothetical protein VPNG_05263 [Cytospora leucostoma]|uniref:Peroxisomal membrane protein 2 n=1 Tax=Cytospora leucostoma TaxID=1230097 RepID=A0A423X7Q9_9PEZI|nr:hypothetical protein VPNG_05263 [Cytospora leucostoma]
MGPLLSTAIRAFFLKAAANVTAQLASRWHTQDPIPQPIDRQRILEFAIYGFFQAQLGYCWHIFLERLFPSRYMLPQETPFPLKPEKKDDDEERRISTEGTSAKFLEVIKASSSGIRWPSVIGKLVLDQTIGMFTFLSIFLVWTNWFRTETFTEIAAIWRAKIFTILYTGWFIWPWVMILNFALVPVEKRQMVSVCVGFCWNVILSLLTHPDPPPSHH